MIPNLPIWIEVLFLLTALMAILFFFFANGKALKATFVIVIWSINHMIFAYSGFYQNLTAMPPRYALVLIPSTLAIIYGLLPKQQEWFMAVRDTNISTLSHLVRLPVEIVLFGLFMHKMVPELMTFEGRNYDIVMGITAPFVALMYMRGRLSKKILFVWNIIGLILVLFILVNGLLSAELPFQLFGFDQPNRAVSFFPFVLLPATIVPLVIWTHISDLIKLRHEMKEKI